MKDAPTTHLWTPALQNEGDRAAHGLTAPLRWRNAKHIRIDTSVDVFDTNVPRERVDELLAVIGLAQTHTFELATRHPQRMHDYLHDPDVRERIDDHCLSLLDKYGVRPQYADALLTRTANQRILRTWPLTNLWIGAIAHDQATTEESLPCLIDTPGSMRFLHLDPLRAPVDLYASLFSDEYAWRGEHPDIPGMNTLAFVDGYGYGLDLLTIHGDTGPDAQPMHPAWVRSLRDQCIAGGVAFNFEGWGAWSPYAPRDEKGRLAWGEAWTMADDGTLYELADLAYPDGPRRIEAIRAGHDKAHLTNLYPTDHSTPDRELDGATWAQHPTPLHDD